MRGGMKFFEQAHIKDIIAFLKVLNNYLDELSWKRILLLYQGIGPAKADHIWQEIKDTKNIKAAVRQLVRIPGNQKVVNGLEIVNQIFNFLLEQKKDFIATAIKQILSIYYGTYLKANFENANDRLEDLNQLANFAMQYDKLDDFLSDVTLAEGFKGETINGYKEGSDESLVLSTIHQAKGLEWKYLFIISLVEGQFPHYKIYDHPEEIEEERRLFYVAVTRAKDELYLTYPIISFSFATGQNINKPSSFISELDNDLFEPWQIDDEVESIEDDEIKYDEDSSGHEFLKTISYDDK